MSDARDKIRECLSPGKSLSKFEKRFPEHWETVSAWVAENVGVVTPSARAIWHYLHQVKGRPLCAKDGCGKHTKWRNCNIGYSTFCSTACSNADDAKKSKFTDTMIKRYGVEHALQCDSIREKSENTLYTNHGVRSPLQSDQIRQKAIDTTQEKYGVDFYAKHPDFVAGVYDKLGCWTSQQPGVGVSISKALLSRPAESVAESIRKARDTSSEKNGIAIPSQMHIAESALSILEDAESLSSLYEEKKSLVAIASTLGVSDVTVGNYFKLHGLKVNSTFSSGQEEVSLFVESMGFEIERNNRTILGKELDIFIPSKMIAIEYCGVFWHSEKFLPKDYHKKKMQLAASLGIRLITLFEDEWKHRNSQVRQKLAHILGRSLMETVYARKTQITEITPAEAKHFMEEFHIQGFGGGFLHLGLSHNGSIVAVMSIRKSSGDEVILNRYATSKRVVGGFTKLLSYFRRQHPNIKIITFADLRWSQGDMYAEAGFSAEKILPPDYSYVIADKRFHKFNFRHKQLSGMKKYDPHLSERENTQAMGIRRIYDCGKIRYSIDC